MISKTINKLDQLITDGQAQLAQIEANSRDMSKLMNARKGEYTAYTTSVLHFFSKILPANSPYIVEYVKIATSYGTNAAQNGIDILNRIRQDVQDGWLLELKGLISAEIFSDFIEMAEHLLTEGYKDPAAVILGAVLEEHLRNLCVKNGIATTTTDPKGKNIAKKASVMNDDLVKAGVYNLLEQKSVTAWLDLRNKAAHGKFSEYELTQVVNMKQGINDFIIRNPL